MVSTQSGKGKCQLLLLSGSKSALASDNPQGCHPNAIESKRPWMIKNPRRWAGRSGIFATKQWSAAGSDAEVC